MPVEESAALSQAPFYIPNPFIKKTGCISLSFLWGSSSEWGGQRVRSVFWDESFLKNGPEPGTGLSLHRSEVIPKHPESVYAWRGELLTAPKFGQFQQGMYGLAHGIQRTVFEFAVEVHASGE